MANYRRRRRRQRRTPTVSYRQKPYRAVIRGPQAAISRTKVRTKVSRKRRALGAVGWNDVQRELDRLKRFRRRVFSSQRAKPAVRSISLVERSYPRRNRGKGGGCIRRPDPLRAAEASVRSRGSGPKQTQEQRLRSFRVWC